MPKTSVNRNFALYEMIWRARNEDKEPCADWLAGFFGRSHGALVCSGSMALELALIHLGIEPEWNVLVGSTSCLQVAASVLRCGATPIIIDTRRDLVLTAEALDFLDDTPQAVIAVHEWGLPCPLAELRERLGERVKIIEDSAQAWAMQSACASSAPVADVVVTSMGPSKVLCIDGGGAAFADTKIDTHIDTSSSNQSSREQPALAVSISKYALPHLTTAVRQAESRTDELRKRVPGLLKQLSDFGLEPWIPKTDSLPSWTFLPILARSQGEFERLRYGPEASDLHVCAPAHPSLEDIPMLRNRAVVIRREIEDARWVLLDPIRALNDPQLFTSWARRSQA